MQALSDEFLDQCPVENGFRLRGENMTRIEVFVDAAFAFAVTMLVISFDRIPESFDEIIIAIKTIPAFAVAVVQLVWIWHAHSQWSERYGLRDGRTVMLSTALLVVMLIYMYPMRIMFAGFFWWISDGYLAWPFQLESIDQVASMFVFLGCGLLTICLIFFLMYRHAISKMYELRLNEYELYKSQTSAIAWIGSGGICVISILFALVAPDELIPYAGYGYFLLGVWIPWVSRYRRRAQQKPGEISV